MDRTESFDDKDEAWQCAHDVAGAIRAAGMAGRYGVTVTHRPHLGVWWVTISAVDQARDQVAGKQRRPLGTRGQ